MNIVITGGAGRIAYSLVPLICKGDVFGSDVKVRLRLLDIEPALGVLQGVVMEIEDSNYPSLLEVIGTTDPAEAFADADVVIMLGGYPRKAGMERKDLISMNAAIIKIQVINSKQILILFYFAL
jgi:malate dehydrogenase